MFTKNTKFDEEVDRLMGELAEWPVNSENYQIALESLERLYELKGKKKFKVSPDTVAVVVGNLAGIVLILNHERLHVVSSKALGFVMRGRV